MHTKLVKLCALPCHRYHIKKDSRKQTSQAVLHISNKSGQYIEEKNANLLFLFPS